MESCKIKESNQEEGKAFDKLRFLKINDDLFDEVRELGSKTL